MISIEDSSEEFLVACVVRMERFEPVVGGGRKIEGRQDW